MIDCEAVAAAVSADDADPRVDGNALRCLPRTKDRGALLLVGVVHDHPASLGRVAWVVERFTPAVLALELPSLAVGLFEQYADDVYTPPRLGGEMSLAIKLVGEVPAVGIDAPSRAYLRVLAERVLSGDLSRSLLGAVLSDLGRSGVHALACHLGAAVGSVTGLRARLYEHLEYDATLLDAPAEQAADEAAHLRKQRAFLGAIEAPPARVVIDAAREDAMAARLRALGARGDVLAVVGMEHLDPLAERLGA